MVQATPQVSLCHLPLHRSVTKVFLAHATDCLNYLRFSSTWYDWTWVPRSVVFPSRQYGCTTFHTHTWVASGKRLMSPFLREETEQRTCTTHDLLEQNPGGHYFHQPEKISVTARNILFVVENGPGDPRDTFLSPIPAYIRRNVVLNNNL